MTAEYRVSGSQSSGRQCTKWLASLRCDDSTLYDTTWTVCLAATAFKRVLLLIADAIFFGLLILRALEVIFKELENCSSAVL